MNNQVNDNETVFKAADRRTFLKGAGLTGIGLASSALLATPAAHAQSAASGLTATDIAVLNFALNLEYLEAEFYTVSLYGQTLEQAGIITNTGTGTYGPTTGGAKVPFADDIIHSVAVQITADEQTHVRLLRQILGDQAIAKPAINLDALGIGFTDVAAFLSLARIAEDIGVSAYGGAAPLLSANALATAARVALTEAYHASALRLFLAQNNLQTFAIDALDQVPPPSGTKYFDLDNNALSVIRTTSQVLALVYGNYSSGTSKGSFFPNGFNGAITKV